MGIEEASKQASKQASKKKHVAIIKECRSFKPLGHAHAHAHAAAPVELQPGGVFEWPCVRPANMCYKYEVGM